MNGIISEMAALFSERHGWPSERTPYIRVNHTWMGEMSAFISLNHARMRPMNGFISEMNASINEMNAFIEGPRLPSLRSVVKSGHRCRTHFVALLKPILPPHVSPMGGGRASACAARQSQ
jgi:hypothetical protein